MTLNKVLSNRLIGVQFYVDNDEYKYFIDMRSSEIVETSSFLLINVEFELLKIKKIILEASFLKINPAIRKLTFRLILIRENQNKK